MAASAIRGAIRIRFVEVWSDPMVMSVLNPTAQEKAARVPEKERYKFESMRSSRLIRSKIVIAP